MDYNPLISCAGGEDFEINHITGDESQILLQFTGLTDKAGKEIYEGDIVKRKNGSIYNGGIGTIEYATDNPTGFPINGYWAKVSDDESFILFPKELEVIGNIYENGDLLK